MKARRHITPLCVLILVFGCCGSWSFADDSPAPQITDLNAKDASIKREKKIPYLKKPYFSTQPTNMNDGIPVGVLGLDGGNKEMILAFARELAADTDKKRRDKTDSLLIIYKGKLVFESYCRRGRHNMPHFQMSITKSYTAFALGRAIQLGYLKMDDLNKPVVSYLKDLDRSKLVKGAETVTLAEALNMRSGIKLNRDKIKKYRDNPESLKGQKQVQAFFECSRPIPPAPRTFAYQGADPALIMQVLEAIVPGSAKDFIRKELMGKMGITEYAWQEDTSGLPKSAAGSSFRSRDMLKFGMLIRDKGRWKGKQLIPQAFMERAVSPISLGWGINYYGYFCWHRTLKHNGEPYPSIELRGALGQFVFLFPKQNLIVVATAHGVMTMLKEIPERIIPAFAK